MEHKLLFDSGLSPLVAAHNTDVLNLDLSYCEAVISSHGHIDHAGGLLNIRKKMDTKQNIPLLLHEHAFRNRLKFQDAAISDLSFISHINKNKWVDETSVTTTFQF